MGITCRKLCNMGDIEEDIISNHDEPLSVKDMNPLYQEHSIETFQMTVNEVQSYKTKAMAHDRLKGGNCDKGVGPETITDDSPHPIETIHYPNGDCYIGHVFNHKREDKGRLTFAYDKGYYEGLFHNNLYEGYGVLSVDDFIYNGNWSKGKKHGEGRLENTKDNTYYVGFWEYDMKHGPGIETFEDGSFFEGNYFQDMKSSNVPITYDEDIEGEKLSFIASMNRTINSNGVTGYSLQGIGIYTQDSEKYIGNYLNDRKNGLGFKFIYKSKSFMIGNWIDDKAQGVVIYSKAKQGINFWQMENNKLIYFYKKQEEIDTIIRSQDFNNLKGFYLFILNNNLLKDLPIGDSIF